MVTVSNHDWKVFVTHQKEVAVLQRLGHYYYPNTALLHTESPVAKTRMKISVVSIKDFLVVLISTMYIT